jgi:integrase/recombinase XerD
VRKTNLSNDVVTVAGSTVAQVSSDDMLIQAWMAGRPATTQRAYRADIAAFLGHVGKPLRQVTVVDVQAFQASLAGRSVASVARALSVVKSLLTFGQQIGYLTFNAGVAVRLPKVENRLAERIIDRDQVRDLLRDSERHSSPRDHAMLMLMYYGGLRISEVCGLEWRHVRPRDEGRCQVTVTGKGGKTRSVILPARVASVLLPTRGDAGDQDPVFRSQKGGRLDASQVHRIVKGAAVRAGLPEGFSAHWLRHANASHALDAGAPAHVVQASLGHASLATTSRYTHARPCDSSGLYLDRC